MLVHFSEIYSKITQHTRYHCEVSREYYNFVKVKEKLLLRGFRVAFMISKVPDRMLCGRWTHNDMSQPPPTLKVDRLLSGFVSHLFPSHNHYELGSFQFVKILRKYMKKGNSRQQIKQTTTAIALLHSWWLYFTIWLLHLKIIYFIYVFEK